MRRHARLTPTMHARRHAATLPRRGADSRYACHFDARDFLAAEQEMVCQMLTFSPAF